MLNDFEIYCLAFCSRAASQKPRDGSFVPADWRREIRAFTIITVRVEIAFFRKRDKKKISRTYVLNFLPLQQQYTYSYEWVYVCDTKSLENKLLTLTHIALSQSLRFGNKGDKSVFSWITLHIHIYDKGIMIQILEESYACIYENLPFGKVGCLDGRSGIQRQFCISPTVSGIKECWSLSSSILNLWKKMCSGIFFLKSSLKNCVFRLEKCQKD